VDNKDISIAITKALELAKKSIQSNLASSGRNASGKTSKSIRITSKVESDRITGTMYGSSVLESLEFGRGKTKNAGSTRSWEKDLRDWMRIRGIDQSAFYPIWRSINTYGWNPQNPSKKSKPIPGRNSRGGIDGLVTDPINVLTESLAKELSIIIIKDIRNNGINGNK
tara:strand:+ start:268 stop:771 length:504 start_codon:yes stop_codon:yes gene_type:complete